MTDKRAEILHYGKKLFSAKGFKNTNVAEIMKAAGLATGTFYNYFSSKESLFMELYNERNVELKKKIMNEIDLDAEPMSVVRNLLTMNQTGMNADPILREWNNREVFSKIERKFREENGLEQVNFLYSGFLEIVKVWQAEGRMRSDIDAEIIMAIFSAIAVMETHKEEIGFQYFPQVIDYISEFTMKGLTEIDGR